MSDNTIKKLINNQIKTKEKKVDVSSIAIA